jgi:hypothetical protein
MSCYDIYNLTDSYDKSLAFELCLDPTTVPSNGDSTDNQINNTIPDTTPIINNGSTSNDSTSNNTVPTDNSTDDKGDGGSNDNSTGDIVNYS